MWIFTSEIYGTKFRVTGCGVASAWSRVAGMLLPITTIYLHELDPFLPYLAMGIL